MNEDNSLDSISVLLFSTDLGRFLQGKSAGGKQRQIHLIFSEIASKGFDITAVVGGSTSKCLSPIDGINILNSPLMVTDGLVSQIKKGIGLYSHVEAIDPDICYVRGNWAYLPILGLLPSDAKIVFGVSNERLFSNFSSKLNTHLRNIALNCADSIICQTSTQEQMLASKYGLSSTVIPNGYPIIRGSDICSFNERTDILWVSRIEPHKNPDIFLDLAEEMPTYQFTMVGAPGGDHSLNHRIQDRANNIGNVTYMGFVAPDKIHALFNNAFALVHTSTEEGFPNVFLESWRYGTPVLSLHHDIEGNLQTNTGGNICRSVDEIEHNIYQLTQNQTYWQNISASSLELFRKNYSLNEVVAKYESVFLELINQT